MQIQLSNWGLRLGSLAVWIRLSIRVLDHLAMEGREKSFIRLQWLLRPLNPKPFRMHYRSLGFRRIEASRVG